MTREIKQWVLIFLLVVASFGSGTAQASCHAGCFGGGGFYGRPIAAPYGYGGYGYGGGFVAGGGGFVGGGIGFGRGCYWGGCGLGRGLGRLLFGRTIVTPFGYARFGGLRGLLLGAKFVGPFGVTRAGGLRGIIRGATFRPYGFLY